MSFLDAFAEFKNASALVTRETNTYVNGRLTKASTTVGTYTCIAYKGSQAERVVGEAIRTRVAMVIILEPSQDIAEKDFVTVDSTNYVVVAVDNVGFGDDAKVVALERLS
jgi:hypothetical protein